MTWTCFCKSNVIKLWSIVWSKLLLTCALLKSIWSFYCYFSQKQDKYAVWFKVFDTKNINNRCFNMLPSYFLSSSHCYLFDLPFTKIDKYSRCSPSFSYSINSVKLFVKLKEECKKRWLSQCNFEWEENEKQRNKDLKNIDMC